MLGLAESHHLQVLGVKGVTVLEVGRHERHGESKARAQIEAGKGH